jgi:hypothetical protein
MAASQWPSMKERSAVEMGNQNDGVECLFDRLLFTIDEKTMAIIEMKAETLAKARVRNEDVLLFAMVLPRVIRFPGIF